jgi:hypothetical protein
MSKFRVCTMMIFDPGRANGILNGLTFKEVQKSRMLCTITQNENWKRENIDNRDYIDNSDNIDSDHAHLNHSIGSYVDFKVRIPRYRILIPKKAKVSPIRLMSFQELKLFIAHLTFFPSITSADALQVASLLLSISFRSYEELKKPCWTNSLAGFHKVTFHTASDLDS